MFCLGPPIVNFGCGLLWIKEMTPTSTAWLGPLHKDARMMRPRHAMLIGRFRLLSGHLLDIVRQSYKKANDDLLCATRYGLMMLRYATTQAFSDKWNRPIEYPTQRYA
jgi:hypothetical protein